MAIFEAFCAFFWPPFLEAFFSPLWFSVFWQHSNRGGHTRNATKQRVSEQCPGFLHLRALWACRHGKILWPRLEDNFLRGLLFCTVRCSKFCRNWVSREKKPLGLQDRARFEKAILRSVSAARANLARGGCAAVSFFFSDLGSLPKMSSRLRCGGFFRLFRFFFRPRFRKPQVVLCTSPSFSLGVSLFCWHSSWDWGQRRIARVFGQLAFNPSYFLGVFLQKHCFSPLKKGYFVAFLSVSLSCLPFVLLGFFHFSLSLSLSLSFFVLSCFFFLPCCLVFIFTFLVFCCSFLSCFCAFVSFVSWKAQHQNITFESFLFIIYFCFFVFQICSYLCFFII